MSIDHLVAQYLTSLQAEGRTPHTLRWHRQSLRQFAAWMDGEGHPADPERWTPTLLRAYVVFHQTRVSARGKLLSASGLNSLVRSLRAFCAWLRLEGFAERDLFARVAVPKPPRLAKPTLNDDEARAVLAAARSGKRNGHRDEAVILFMLDTGARAGEVCGLLADGIDWERRIARVHGKGRKDRFVPFSATTATAMQRYAVRARKGSSERFFESEEGAPLTPSGLGQICKRLSARAGVPFSPHKLRHTFSISYLRAGGSAFALQKTLGHTTLDTTLRYVAMVADDLIAEHEQHSPVAALVSRGGKHGVGDRRQPRPGKASDR